MNINKLEYHKRPTYAELVRDTITNPKDKIALPDRYATQLRNTPQMTRYDDESFLDLTQDNKTIMVEQMKQTTVRQQVAATNTKTHTMEKETNTEPRDEPMPASSSSSSSGKPPPPPPASGHKFYGGVNNQGSVPPRTAAPSQKPDETMLPTHAPAPPPPPPPAAAAAVPSGPAQAMGPDYTPHLERTHALHVEHLNHITSNFQKVQGAMLAGIKHHMGPTINLITQHMSPQVAAPSSTAAPPVNDPMDVTAQGGGRNPKPPPPPGGRVVGNGLGMRRKPVEQASPYGKSKERAKATIAGPSQPPPGPGPGKPPAPKIQVAEPLTQPKMDTDSRAKNPGQAVTAGDVKRIKLEGKAAATPSKLTLSSKGGKGLGSTKKSAKPTFKEAEAEVINLPETKKAPPPGRPKRVKLVGKGNANTKRASRIQTTATKTVAETSEPIERPNPKRRKLVGKGTLDATKRVTTTSGVDVPATATDKRRKLTGKGSATATNRTATTSGVTTNKKSKADKSSGDIEATTSSSSGPAPPAPPANKVGKGKGGKTPQAPNSITLPALVTEIKKAIKGDALNEKDTKTSNIIFEKIKIEGAAANPNGIKKLRSIYGKSVYKPRAVF
jgi:hypothetical protein